MLVWQRGAVNGRRDTFFYIKTYLYYTRNTYMTPYTYRNDLEQYRSTKAWEGAAVERNSEGISAGDTPHAPLTMSSSTPTEADDGDSEAHQPHNHEPNSRPDASRHQRLPHTWASR